MEILILGAGGMAGHVAAVYLQERGHNVIGFTREPIEYCNNIVGNALNQKTIESMITKGNYDAIVNCIGVLNKSVDENPKDGIYLNSYLPHFILDCLKQKSTKLIHISTDCVFSGNIGGYKENSFCDADSLYGRSKALGEINDNKNLTIRTSIIGPDRKKDGIGLLNWFLKQEGSVNGYINAIWTGVSTITLAKAIESAIVQNISGIYHLVNNETINKYQLLNLFNKYIKKEEIKININEDYSVDKSLVNSRTDFDFKVPSYDEMIKETNDWIETHKQFYPHYLKR